MVFFRRISFIILTFSFIHIFPWIYLNSDYNKSIERFVKLTEDKSWSDYSRAYAFDELRAFYCHLGDRAKNLNYGVKAYEQIKSERYKSNLAIIYMNEALFYFKKKNYRKAFEMAENVLKIDPENVQAINLNGTVLKKYGKYKQAKDLFMKM